MLIYIIPFGMGAFMYALFMMLFGGRVAKREHAENRIKELTNDKKEYSLGGSGQTKSFLDRVIKPLLSKLTGIIGKILPINKEKDNKKLKQQLEQAGLAMTPEDYTTLQLVLMLLGGLGGALYGMFDHADIMYKLLYTIGGVYAVYALMRYGLSAKINSRKAAMEKQLPEMLDLLSVSVEAGMAFERSMLHVTETMEGPLIDELTVTYREMSMGRSRKEALTLMAERCGLPELESFTGAIVQAGQLGIPMRNVLKTQSEAMRSARRAKVQEKAQQVSTKILIPMLLFIFPVLFVVLLAPSLISIMGNLG
ncbi:MAG: type II secretion system F family protein [Erysipelotrichaceae bacterium]|nr:type II secretion system F family protein [Erysipelotrichaceae bacterium]